ncbi:MAG: pyrophosphatase PpaX [Firmicutes bacterium]|nr:pyrophosphatase PpaX [Bacillota bacterium]
MIYETSAGGVIIYKGKVLVVRNRFGNWVFPKGHIEAGENAEQAALREVEEEVGLKAKIREAIGQTHYQFTSGGILRDKTVHWFLMDVANPIYSLNRREGFVEAAFAPVEEAQALLAHDNDRLLLENIADKIKTEELEQSMKLTTILFDLDGTLIDTRKLVVASFQHTFKKVLNIEVTAQDVLQDYGRPLTYTFGRYTQDPATVDEMLRVYREHNVIYHDSITEAFPLVYEDVLQLHQAGFRLGIVTSKKRPVVLMGVRLFDLEHFFEVYVCEEDTKKHKPGPEPILEALKQMKVKPEETIYVGDSPYDILSAKAAGVYSAAVIWSNFPETTWQELKPDLILSRLNELEEYLI